MSRLICPICIQEHPHTDEGIKQMTRCHEIVDNWHRQAKQLKMEGLVQALNVRIKDFNDYMIQWNLSKGK